MSDEDLRLASSVAGVTVLLIIGVAALLMAVGMPWRLAAMTSAGIVCALPVTLLVGTLCGALAVGARRRWRERGRR